MFCKNRLSDSGTLFKDIMIFYLCSQDLLTNVDGIYNTVEQL